MKHVTLAALAAALVIAGPALAHYDTHSVLAAVLGLMTPAHAQKISFADTAIDGLPKDFVSATGE